MPEKIASFSRSLITPEGFIFLLGGEDSDKGAQKTVYCCDINNIDQDRSLKLKKHMLCERFDFSLCYLEGYIYVMCGKDSNLNIIPTCHRYSLEKD